MTQGNQSSQTQPEEIPREVLLRAYNRERAARERAEALLEEKSRDLYLANQELRKNQDSLIQSAKMASLGVLAAGVAHEINNPLGFIYSNTNTLRRYTDAFLRLLETYKELPGLLANENPNAAISQVMDRIREIEKEEEIVFVLDDINGLISETIEGLGRVTDIVRNLKTFARLDVVQTREVDVHELIDSTLMIARTEIVYKCTVNKHYGDIPPITCCPGQLNQVFLNLIVNAVQAIEEAGEINIKTSLSGEQVLIEVSDTGKGIPAENLAEIFNPFFTTKPVGSGTGLGLSVSLGIIEKHQGKIEVQSEIGKGTTFAIILPINPIS